MDNTVQYFTIFHELLDAIRILIGINCICVFIYKGKPSSSTHNRPTNDIYIVLNEKIKETALFDRCFCLIINIAHTHSNRCLFHHRELIDVRVISTVYWSHRNWPIASGGL